MKYSVVNVAYTIITAVFLGFQTEPDKFFIYFMSIFLLTVAASALVFWVSAGTGNAAVATLLIPLSFVIQMVSVCVFGYVFICDCSFAYYSYLEDFLLQETLFLCG